MMATNKDRHDTDRAVTLKTVALSALMVLILLLAMGIVAGASFALLDGSSKGPAAIIFIVVGLAAAAVALWGLNRLRPWVGSGEPISPKTRKANKLLLFSGLLGGLIGAALSISTVGMDDPFLLFSTAPLPTAAVVPALAVWLLVVPLISWQWHRNVDEHEAQSYQLGGLAALYLYAFLAPAWWFAWRGGLVAEPDTMVIYLIVLVVWCVGWFWRRYR